MQTLLLVIRQISENMFIFQQESVPAHPARRTIDLLSQETHGFIAPY